MRMIRVLTSGKQKLKQCVDYCLGVLVSENIRTLVDITMKRVRDIQLGKELNDELTVVSEFLNHWYCSNLESDEDPVHCTRRSLVRNGESETETVHEEFSYSCEAVSRFDG